MTVYFEDESGKQFDFPLEETAEKVIEAVLEQEGCPYETVTNVLLTDGETVREMNRMHRGIDSTTDVLSFPNIDFMYPGDFTCLEEDTAGCFDPDSGEAVLGDIVLSAERIREQAEAYGHSEEREFAFLIAHSVLHLCGFDHMEQEEAAVMEAKQEAALQKLGITRDRDPQESSSHAERGMQQT